MSDKLSPSPAVASLQDEQARQSDQQSELTSSLEDSFPASDPISMSSGLIAGGTIEAKAEQDVEPAPKVDAALAAIRSRSPEEREEMALAELRAMKDELTLLAQDARRSQVAPRFSLGSRLTLPSEIDSQIRLHPIAAVAAAALFGYVWGRVR